MNYLKIGQEQYPVSFGYGALMAYETATGVGVSATFEAFSRGESRITDVLQLIACGLENGARKANAPRAYTPQDVADMLDDAPDATEVIAQAMQILADSFPQPDEAAKKKTTKQTTAKSGGLR